MRIRDYEGKDAPALAELYVRSVRQIGPRDYSAKQVEAWAALCPSPKRLHDASLDGRLRFVAVDNSDQPIAFADLAMDGHIQYLYCSPEVAGQGIASALYDALERGAQLRGVNRLYSEASEAARRFFMKKGFAVISMRRFKISGVRIHNYAVEKTLLNERTG